MCYVNHQPMSELRANNTTSTEECTCSNEGSSRLVGFTGRMSCDVWTTSTDVPAGKTTLGHSGRIHCLERKWTPPCYHKSTERTSVTTIEPQSCWIGRNTDQHRLNIGGLQGGATHLLLEAKLQSLPKNEPQTGTRNFRALNTRGK